MRKQRVRLNKQKTKIVSNTFKDLMNKGYTVGQAGLFISRHARNKSSLKVLKQIRHEASKERRIY